MSQLELRNLRKAYGSKIVPVKDIDILVDEGEFLTLLGPSGCGKSTILRLIAGLEPPTSGEILINGQNVNRLSPGDRNIAMVFQSYALYPHMTVYENIASGLKLRKMPETQVRQRIANVSEFLGLSGLMDRKPGQMSGGQRQRVAVARALVREPEVFLLDEPLSNLDALLREQVRAELKQLFSSQRVPVVYVTHDQTEAMTLSTRVAVLNQGEVQQLDTPEQIYSRPANQFVAGFIGSPQMTFLPLPTERGYALLRNIKIPMPDAIAPSNREVILGIRPEDVKLPAEEGIAADDVARIRGEVFLVENLGMSKLVSVKLAAGADQTVTLRGMLPVENQYRTGELLELALPLRSLHWFHPETRQALV